MGQNLISFVEWCGGRQRGNERRNDAKMDPERFETSLASDKLRTQKCFFSEEEIINWISLHGLATISRVVNPLFLFTVF